MSEFKYDVVEKYAVLSTSVTGWSKEVRLISWNNREPKLDIREWAVDDTKISKGLTFSKEEFIKLRDCLNSIEF